MAQLLVDEGATAREVGRSGIEMLTARIPRDVGGQPAESLLFFFSARGGTFQIDCQFTEDHRRQIVQGLQPGDEDRRVQVGQRAMRLRGLEPPRACAHGDLNAARLPIPPQPRDDSL